MFRKTILGLAAVALLGTAALLTTAAPAHAVPLAQMQVVSEQAREFDPAARPLPINTGKPTDNVTRPTMTRPNRRPPARFRAWIVK